MGKTEEALTIVNKLSKEFPTDYKVSILLAELFFISGNLERALEVSNKIIVEFPKDCTVLNLKALVYSDLDELELAIEYFKKSIHCDKNNFSAHLNLSRHLNYAESEGDLHFSLMLELLKDSKIHKQRYELHFALSKAYDDKRDFHNSFSHLVVANSLKKNQLAYDFQTDLNDFTKIRQISLPRLVTRNRMPNCVVPVFIIGLPRSGTSLVEQILSSHESVYGCGELNDLTHFCRREIQKSTPFTHESLTEFSFKYLKKLKTMSDGEYFVTDKMPFNFKYVSIINKLFPQSKVVHVIREPLANVLSLFQTNFSSQGNGFCYSLEDIKAYYNLYFEHMKSELINFPGFIKTVKYEDLVLKNKETVTDILDFIGLNIDDRCFSHHLNNRIVKTASRLGVRQKLYNDKVSYYKNYQKYLDVDFGDLPQFN